MRSSHERPSVLREHGAALSRAITRAFPTPTLLTPHAAGIDISDSSIKWLVLTPGETHRVATWGELSLEPGIVESGIIRDVSRLSAALAQVRGKLGAVRCAHAALPEEAAYVFGMQVPFATRREQVLRMIEFEFEDRVPIPPNAAVFDFNTILPRDGEDDEVSVVVFPRDVSEGYAAAFAGAGIELLSLEVEARSIARAVSTDEIDESITLLVDFGRARTGFAVLKHGMPIFTSTVEVGGDMMTKTLIESMQLSAADAEIFKNEQGLIPQQGGRTAGLDAVTGTAAALSDEVARHYHYWDTRRNDRGERVTPVGKVVLVGGSSNLRGLTDYIAARVHAPVEIGDVWRHVAPYDEYIPPIERRHSLQFATAVGLALRGL